MTQVPQPLNHELGAIDLQSHTSKMFSWGFFRILQSTLTPRLGISKHQKIHKHKTKVQGHTSLIAVSMEAALLASKKRGFPEEQKSIIAAKISGFKISQEASSDFVTVIKSDPKKTRVIPVLAKNNQSNSSTTTQIFVIT